MKNDRYMKGTFVSVAGPQLDYRIWLPEGKPKAIVQLVHGMAEHIDRYDATARAFSDAGYLVVGHTHLGHGPRADVKGYFAKKDGWQCLIDDVHALRLRTEKHYPGLPYILLGHSMGSFVARCYIQQYAEGMAGVVLSGTGYFPKPMVLAGLAAANLVCFFGGAKKPSPLINRLAFSSSNKPFAPNRTDFDWLTRVEAEVDQYVADPCCGFLFTGSGYRDMFRGLNRLANLKNLQKVPKGLPVMLISGDQDPVGGMGAGVKQVAAEFVSAGVKDTVFRLHTKDRHEVFNEEDREEAWAEVIQWMDEQIG